MLCPYVCDIYMHRYRECKVYASCIVNVWQLGVLSMLSSLSSYVYIFNSTHEFLPLRSLIVWRHILAGRFHMNREKKGDHALDMMLCGILGGIHSA